MRILCRGNELLGDDAVVELIARQIRQVMPPDIEIVITSGSGSDLIYDVANTPSLVVVEAVQTGSALPGAVHLLDEDDLQSSPCLLIKRYAEIRETIELGRTLHIPMPEKVVVLGIEVADLEGSEHRMLPAVRAAAPVVAELIEEMLPQWA